MGSGQKGITDESRLKWAQNVVGIKDGKHSACSLASKRRQFIAANSLDRGNEASQTQATESRAN
ncbi:hypothetical protein VE00_06411 [Pseudogymnoascus sp. WSF 3629]|nr:hypothetical protein VE00_06411 [Pseudogymnoascus sp. WSF 3629]